MASRAATDPSPTARKAPRERIVDTASELFYAHGLRGVGIDRIIADSGVAKATMYAHFSSKDELAAEYLRRRDALWSGKLRASAQAAGDDPREQLVGMFDALGAAYDRHGFNGCAFVNAMSESEPGTQAHTVAAQHKAAVRVWVEELAERAGAAEPSALATQLTLLIDGTLVAGRVQQDRGVVDAATAAARVLVAAACP